MSPVLGCDLGCALGGVRSGGCGSGKVGVGLLKWGLGYVTLGSLDVDRSSWWCAISPVLGCDEPVLVCGLAGAGVRSRLCFRRRKIRWVWIRQGGCGFIEMGIGLCYFG